jgi:hypothetical protein
VKSNRQSREGDGSGQDLMRSVGIEDDLDSSSFEFWSDYWLIKVWRD